MRAADKDVDYRALFAALPAPALLLTPDLVIVHEWSEPWVVAALGQHPIQTAAEGRGLDLPSIGGAHRG